MSQPEWNRHEDTIRRLYIDEGRRLEGPDGVIETMRAKHSFEKTKSQYEFQFRKWKLFKNRKKTEWERLSRVLQARKAKGLESEVFYKGKLIPSAKVAKEVSRRWSGAVIPWLQNNSIPQCPPRFHVRHPINFVQHTFLTANLPLTLFQSRLLGTDSPSRPRRADSGSAPHQAEAPQHEGHHLSDLFGPDALDFFSQLSRNKQTFVKFYSQVIKPSEFYSQVVEPRLHSLIPGILAESSEAPSPASTAHGARESASPDRSPTKQRDLSADFIRLLIFILSNNMLEEEEFPLDNIWKYLREETPRWLPMICRLRREDNPTASVLIRAFFRCAITSGDVHIVRRFLRERLIDPLAGEIVYSIDGRSYRPFELSLVLGSPAITTELFDGGFNDVDLRKLVRPPSRTAWALSFWYKQLPGLSPREDILFYLLSKDASSGRVSYIGTLFNIFHDQFGPRTVILCLEAATPDQLRTWCIQGSCQYLSDYNEDEIAEIVEILTRNGIQEEHHPDQVFAKSRTEKGRRDPSQSSSTDSARDHLVLVKALIEAVWVGDYSIIYEFVRLGGDISAATARWSVWNYYDEHFARGPTEAKLASYLSVYSEALRRGDPKLIQDLENWGVIELLQGRDQWRAAWGAALETGNEKVLQRMLAGIPTVREEGFVADLIQDALRVLRADVALLLTSDHQIYLSDIHISFLFELSVQLNLDTVAESLLDRGLWMEGHSESSQILYAVIRSGRQPLLQKVLVKFRDENGALESGLWMAVKQGNRAIVDLFLDLINPSKESLRAAVTNGDLSIAKYLLQRGADPLNEGALLAATEHGHMPMVKFLVGSFKSRYPNGVETYGSKTLYSAVINNRAGIVDYLVEQSIGMTPGSFPEYPLITAIDNVAKGSGSLDMVRKLLQAGFDPNWMYDWGGFRETPILVAIKQHNIPLIQLLVEHGASIDHPALGGLDRTPFQRVVELGNLEIIHFFLNHGADINEKPAIKYGATALQLAAITGRAGIAQFLLQWGAEVNAPGAKYHGRTALEGAAEHGRLDTVKLLINAGAGTGPGGAEQVEKALELSNKRRHPEVWRMIKDHFEIQDRKWDPKEADWDTEESGCDSEHG